MGDFRGLTKKLDYLQDLGITAIWLLPFFPVTLARRRLRHLRLQRCPSRLRDAAGFPEFPEAGPSPRHPRHHRGGAEPHLRPASLVPALAPRRARNTLARFLRLERHGGKISGRAHHLQGFRNLQLDLGPGRQSVLLASLLLAPARSQLRQSARARGDPGGDRFLVRSGRRRIPPGRRALISTSAKAPTARTCPKRTRS